MGMAGIELRCAGILHISASICRSRRQRKVPEWPMRIAIPDRIRLAEQAPSSLRPVQQEKLSTLSYEALLGALLRREFAPGQQLNLTQLSHQLRVSGTPLKEAVRFLADQGLLEVRPRQGTYVAAITEQSLGESIEARLLIADWAVEMLHRRARDEEWRNLDRILQETAIIFTGESRARDVQQRFTKLDFEFHRTIIQACHNDSLLRAYEGIGATFQLARAWALKEPEALHDRMLESVAEHREILEYARGGPSKQAKRSMRLHIDRSFQGALGVIREYGGAI